MRKMPTSRGFILVYSLIVLFLLLATGISMMNSSLADKRSVFAARKSSLAFQIADSGGQRIISRIRDASSSDQLSDLGDCNSGKISASISDGTAIATFFRADGVTMNCGGPISNIHTIKIVGFYGDVARAIHISLEP